MRKLLVFCLMLSSMPLQARVEPREGEEAIAPEPQITIVEDGDKTLNIYQINGKVYGIKVVPKNAPPYHLVDTNGDGTFIRDAADRILVPEWVLMSW